MRYGFLLSVVSILLGISCSEEGAEVSRLPSSPNVVFIITDDQGYADLGSHGHPLLKTPELDKLHAESVRLTDFHVSPTCTPTRGALMSGQWTNRAGSWHTIMGRSMMFQDKTTLAQVFADNGYATGMFGKWHLGDNYPYRPEDRGFQEVVRHAGGGIGQTPDFWDNNYFDDTYFHNGEPRPFSGYCTDVFFSEAKRFIQLQASEGKPFFAYISTNAPHGPFLCPEKYWQPYLEHEGVDERLAIFFGMIANIDENVGALRSWLAEEGLAENTIFIFMTDNGTASGAQYYNAGMRAGKGSAYDGGHRVPFFLHWPADGFNKPIDVDRITAHVDILPTLMELCELTPLEGYLLDGKSLVPLLRDPAANWPERVIITDSQRVRDPIKWKDSSTMTDRWRLINGKQLYDIQTDPGQKSDIAADHPEVVQRLTAAYDTWWQDVSQAFDQDTRLHVGNDAENPAVLTCHDWLTDGSSPPWHQGMVRRGQRGTGEWSLTFEQAGTYRISLRRWPRESGLALRISVAAPAPVPGLKAYGEEEGMALDIISASIRITGLEVSEKILSDAQ
ncbi:MAG: arylsulfatase [Verrucomicrobiota bacterium]